MNNESQQSSNQISNAELTEAPPPKLPLDDLTKAIAVLVGSLYVVGILATNTYLYSLGVTDFSLLKARYIYTGVLVLVPIFLCTLGPVFGIHYSQYNRNIEVPAASSPFDRWFLGLMKSRLASWEMLIIGFGLPFFVFFFFFIKEQGDIISSILQSLWMYLLCFGAGFFGTMMIASFLPKSTSMRLLDSIFPWGRQEKRTARVDIKNEPPNWITAFGLALFIIGYFAYYLSLFGDHILIQIPEQFGGTKPHQAQILFKKDTADGARELGIEVPADATLSEELTVLFESENVIVVRLSNEHVIQLSKDMVEAVKITLPKH